MKIGVFKKGYYADYGFPVLISVCNEFMNILKRISYSNRYDALFSKTNFTNRQLLISLSIIGHYNTLECVCAWQ